MTTLQYAPKTDVSTSSANLHAELAERPSSRGNATSHRGHHTLEEATSQVLDLGVGFAPRSSVKQHLESRSSMLASPVASNEPESHFASSDNSQSTTYTESTGPTTLSAPSSQNPPSSLPQMTQLDATSEAPTDSGHDGAHANIVDPQSQPNFLRIHTTPTSPTTATFPAQVLHLGQKRTASGHAKLSSSSLPTSPVEASGRGHTRNTSVNSSGNQIGELSLQLRTRLSYAMVKVQNGWQSHSLGEVESLAAQQVSPTSTPSTLHGPQRVQQSPRSTATPAETQAGSSQSPGKGAEATRLQYAIDESLPMGSAAPPHSYQSLINKQTSPSSTQTPTYESFWRQHSAKPTTGTKDRVLSTKPAGPSLEPPANIFSRNTRRSNSQQVQPPVLYTNNLSNLSTSSETSAISFIPATPPPASQRRATATRTPSQNAAMEKDAVETLLFMSSPVNPGYHANSRNGPSPGTPVRTPYRATGKRVEFAGTGTRGSVGLESSDEEPRTLGVSKSRAFGDHSVVGRIDKEDDIDRMLDAMDSSSDDEI